MSISHRWVVPAAPFTTPCSSCHHASDCRTCPTCGSEVHVVEDYAPAGRCHCGRTPVRVEP